MYNEELIHYGVKGMKWGKRKKLDSHNLNSNIKYKNSSGFKNKRNNKKDRDELYDHFNTKDSYTVKKYNNSFKYDSDKGTSIYRDIHSKAWKNADKIINKNYKALKSGKMSSDEYYKKYVDTLSKEFDKAIKDDPRTKYKTKLGREYVLKYTGDNVFDIVEF